MRRWRVQATPRAYRASVSLCPCFSFSWFSLAGFAIRRRCTNPSLISSLCVKFSLQKAFGVWLSSRNHQGKVLKEKSNVCQQWKMCMFMKFVCWESMRALLSPVSWQVSCGHDTHIIWLSRASFTMKCYHDALFNVVRRYILAVFVKSCTTMNRKLAV